MKSSEIIPLVLSVYKATSYIDLIRGRNKKKNPRVGPLPLKL